MTLVEDAGMGAHVGELRLRRFRIGELPGAERDEIERHTAGCGTCRARLAGLDDEQAAFEQEIPFPRFAGGVERARRVPRARPRSLVAVVATLGICAAAAALLVVGPLGRPGDPAPSHNNIKGGREASARIGAEGRPQRAALGSGIEALRPGERVLLGYRTDAAGFVAALSIDDGGVVTPLYPEAGPSLAAAPGRAPTYFPDGLELTGAGRERVYVVLADRPFTVEALAAAVKAAYTQAGRDLTRMGAPALGGTEAFTWLFAKP